MGIPLVAVTLLHRKGYFTQRIDAGGWQHEEPVEWLSGSEVPVIFLDANLPGNSDCDRSLTGCFYGGDSRYRLCQETILGICGVRMLEALGQNTITTGINGPAIHYECEKVHVSDASGSCLERAGELPKMRHDPGTDDAEVV